MPTCSRYSTPMRHGGDSSPRRLLQRHTSPKYSLRSCCAPTQFLPAREVIQSGQDECVSLRVQPDLNDAREKERRKGRSRDAREEGERERGVKGRGGRGPACAEHARGKARVRERWDACSFSSSGGWKTRGMLDITGGGRPCVESAARDAARRRAPEYAVAN